MKRDGLFTFSNFSTAILIAFVLSVFLFPEVKATMIKSMMKIGLFQPDLGANPAKATEPAEDVAFADVNGKSVTLSSLKGKVVFINFWTTWCPPCRAEMPSIHQLYNKYKQNKNVVFLMVDADGKLPAADKFMKKKGYDMPVYSIKSNVPESLFSGTLPTTIILNKSGQVVFNGTGAADYSNPKVAALMDKLLL